MLHKDLSCSVTLYVQGLVSTLHYDLYRDVPFIVSYKIANNLLISVRLTKVRYCYLVQKGNLLFYVLRSSPLKLSVA